MGGLPVAVNKNLNQQQPNQLPVAGTGDNGILGGVKVDGITVTIDAEGVISSTGGGGTSPGAPDDSVQFNEGGTFTGDANLLWDNTDKALHVGPASSDLNPLIQDIVAPAQVLINDDGTSPADDYATLAVQGQSTQENYSALAVAACIILAAVANAATAIEADLYTSGPDNLTTAQAIYAFFEHDGDGVVNSAAGLTIDSMSNAGAGSITTATGLQINDQTAGDTNFAIQTGQGPCSFGDEIRTPDLLLVPGSAPVSLTDGQIWYDSGSNTFKCQIGGVTKTITVS
jgi:hypothetical protein